ncbi:MAG: hypothetical protein R6V77_06935 [Candidatus Cloacimonadaceae bacterium]
MKIRVLVLLLLTLLLLTAVPLSAKSIPKAMLMSAILPGAGEIYAGSLTRGMIFTTADAVMLFSAWHASSEITRLDDSFKQFAYAKLDVPKDSSGDYYELLHDYSNSAVYNAEVELYFRNLGLIRYNDPAYYNDQILLYSIPSEDSWQWENDSDWKKYKSIRKDKQTQILDRKLAIGAAIANRIISVLDTAVLVRKHNKKLQPSFSITPDFINNGAVFSCSLEF